MQETGRKTQSFVAAGLAVFTTGAILLSLFAHWEMSNETWGYWSFARISTETGKFIIIDRSPLYTVYLNFFRWLGYPTSVTVEYVVTTLITIAALLVLYRSYLGMPLSIFSAVLWIPFMQVSEPPVQKLALACSCLAVAIRQHGKSRFLTSLSYALLGITYLFRTTYLIFIVLFVIWDFARIVKRKSIIRNQMLLPQLKTDWPALIVISLFVYFLVFQSAHRWNTIWFASAKWFPFNGKKFEIIQPYNWSYILRKYGTLVNHDFYFTNQELFNGAKTSLAALLANPRFISQQVSLNIRQGVFIIVRQTLFPYLHARLKNFHPMYVFLLFFLTYGAFRGAKNSIMRVFLVGNIFIVAISIVVMPFERYLIPLIPVFVSSAYWYSKQIYMFQIRVLSSISIIKLPPAATQHVVSKLLPFIILTIFSNGLQNWKDIVVDVFNDLRINDVRIMEVRSRYYNYSMKASYYKLASLTRNCNGIMTLEYNFVASFMDIPLRNIYDVWEIPPFGQYRDPVYTGLIPERIDCLLISHDLEVNQGAATNFQIRFQNYVKPYAEHMMTLGAKWYTIESYGNMIVFSNDSLR